MIPSGNHNNSIAARIKEARAALGLTQKELCEITGMKLPSLRDYELGNSIPGGDAIGLLTKADINAHWLITGQGKKLITDVNLPNAAPRDIANIKRQIVGTRSIFPLKHTVNEEDEVLMSLSELPKPSGLDMPRFLLAIEAVEEGLAASNRTMLPDKKAELFLAVYDMMEEPTITKDRVLKLVKLAA